jgi:hypothetical protein
MRYAVFCLLIRSKIRSPIFGGLVRKSSACALESVSRTASAINSPFHPSLGRVRNFATLQKPLSQFALPKPRIPTFRKPERGSETGIWSGCGACWGPSGAPRPPGARVPVKGQPGGECGNVCLAREQSLFVRSPVRPLLLAAMGRQPLGKRRRHWPTAEPMGGEPASRGCYAARLCCQGPVSPLNAARRRALLHFLDFPSAIKVEMGNSLNSG